MKAGLIFLVLAVAALVSCNRGGLQKGEGGLLYEIHIDKSGQKIQEGDFVSLNMVAKTDADSVLKNTYESGFLTYSFLQRPQHNGDLNAALLLLTEGDSATIKTYIDSIYDKNGPCPQFKGNYINYEVKVEKVIPKGSLSEADFNIKVLEYKKEQKELLRIAEPEKLKKYIAVNKLSGATTPSGLFYAITQPGAGNKAVAGDTVIINYVAKYVDNEVFDTNIMDVGTHAKNINYQLQYRPFAFVVGASNIVPAWNEGLQFLNKGAKAVFVSPSGLAYIGKGNQGTRPYTPVVYEITLIDLKHPAK